MVWAHCALVAIVCKKQEVNSPNMYLADYLPALPNPPYYNRSNNVAEGMGKSFCKSFCGEKQKSRCHHLASFRLYIIPQTQI